MHLDPHKDPDEFIKAEGAEAFEERLQQAEDSFLFRIHVLEKSCQMNTPQGQNSFFEKCASYLLDLSDELERNIYIEAIIKEYGSRTGISAADLKSRVGTLAMKGTPSEGHTRPEPPPGQNRNRKKEDASVMAQKLLITWLVNYPHIYPEVRKYIQPEDFVTPIYRQTAELLYAQEEEGDVNPGRLLNHFNSEDQKEVAAMFDTPVNLTSEEEMNSAFADTVLKIKGESLAKKNTERDPADMQQMQQLISEQKELEALSRKKQSIRVKFNDDSAS